MARLSFFTQLLVLSFAAFLLASDSDLINAVHQSHRAAGVFMLIEAGKYTFNFTAARAACLFLNVTMATRAQMLRAVQHGLETCKFGWIAEQVAVVPRLTANVGCGRNNTGVVQWNASPDKKFGVFCFNASALEETPSRPTAGTRSSTFSTTAQTTWTQTSTAAALRSTTRPPPSRKPITTKASEQTSSAPQVKTTHSSRISSTSLKSFSTHIPTSPSHLITSTPSVFSFAFSTASNFSVSSESLTVSPTKSSLGDVPTALIILSIILLLLMAAGVVWFYKLNIFTFWSPGQQKDEIETEMWKQTGSETDLHSQHDEEEEESDRKYSSDITLCVNPDVKTNSSE